VAREAATAGVPTRERTSTSGRGRGPSLRVLLFSGVLALLSGVVGFAISRESGSSTSAPVVQRPALPTPRPALARSEQQYVEALWPIHSSVERAAVRVALGTSFYKLRDLSRAELKTRLEQASAEFRTAEQRLRELTPPTSLQARHQSYLSALQLFQSSTREMLRMFDDGNDEHLAQGFPLSVQGSDQIRAVGDEFWPDEYPPN
jgi:hypothetical protein